MNLLILKNSGREEPRIIRLSSSANGMSIEDLHSPFAAKRTWVVAACKGLICFCRYDRKNDYLLWNPLTDEYKVIPHPSFELPPCRYAGHHTEACTQFDYCIGSGFGFDVRSGDYKFIKFTSISYADEDDRTHSFMKQISVYSLNKNSWKEIPNPELYDIRDYSAVSVNGFCYWRASKNILAFNLATDEFSTIPFPNILFDKDYKSYLIEYDGSLFFVACLRYGDEKCFRFWIMDEEDGAVVWLRKENLFVCGFGALNPLGFCKRGCSFLFQGRDGTLTEYDFATREMKSIQHIFDYPRCMKLHSYIESNVKLNEEDEEDED